MNHFKAGDLVTHRTNEKIIWEVLSKDDPRISFTVQENGLPVLVVKSPYTTSSWETFIVGDIKQSYFNEFKLYKKASFKGTPLGDLLMVE